MKKYYIFYLFVLLILSGCASNGDENITPAPPLIEETIKPLSVDNLAGKWEVYFFTKSVNSNTALRYVDFDGFTITFKTDKSFFETNAKGDVTKKGTFEVSRSDSLTFYFKTATNEDTISSAFVTLLSDKRFVTIDRYQAKFTGSPAIFNIVDTKLWRNTVTYPNGLLGAVGVNVLTIEQLQGQWEIYSFREYINSNLASDNAVRENEAKGVVYQFNSDMTYKEFGKSGKLATYGTFVIVNDVVHLFSATLVEGKKESFTVWITDYTSNEFTFYSKTMSPIGGSSSISVIESFTKLRRKNS